MSPAYVIETTDLRKDYEGVAALRGLTLQVPTGSICGLLGRNGAGKTTAIKVLLGMVRPTSGAARVFGLPADVPASSVAIRRRIGFVSDEKDLYDFMTVEGLIRFTASFYPKWQRTLEAQYLRKFDLPMDRKVKSLSRGMRAKLALLLVLSRGADLLMLDEPTSGLDPAVSEEVLQALVGHVASEGMTVFFSSHHLAEVEQIADHVAIIEQGQAVVAGSLDALRERYCRVQLVFSGDAPDARFQSPGVVRMHRRGRTLTVLSSAGREAIVAEARALNPVAVDVTPVTLKDIFLETVVTEN